VTSRERREHLKVPGQFLSPGFKPHIALLATNQYTFPNTVYLATLFTTILFYYNSPALMSQQQRRLTADRTRLSRQERQKRREVRREHAQISQSRDRVTRIPPTLESVTAGSTVSKRGNAGLGPASSRHEIPEPVPDNPEPVPDN